MGCFSGCLMSSASIQKLFCGIYSAFKCSSDEFVGEKVVSPSYSFGILGPPPSGSKELMKFPLLRTCLRTACFYLKAGSSFAGMAEKQGGETPAGTCTVGSPG